MLPDSAAEERARTRSRRFNDFDFVDVVVNGFEEGLVSGTRDWTDETHAYATTRPRVRRLEDDAGIFRRSSYREFKRSKQCNSSCTWGRSDNEITFASCRYSSLGFPCSTDAIDFIRSS